MPSEKVTFRPGDMFGISDTGGSFSDSVIRCMLVSCCDTAGLLVVDKGAYFGQIWLHMVTIGDTSMITSAEISQMMSSHCRWEYIGYMWDI